jgi:hypothetical protein
VFWRPGLRAFQAIRSVPGQEVNAMKLIVLALIVLSISAVLASAVLADSGAY